jgi:hypothetical protein
VIGCVAVVEYVVVAAAIDKLRNAVAGLRYGSGEKERTHQASAILRKVKVR